MTVKFSMELTLSQKMALVDALIELTRTPDSTQTFIDCSNIPATETTVTDLLRLVNDAKYIPPASADTKARTA